MKKILAWTFSLLMVAVVAAAFVPFLIPVETYKQELTAQVKKLTGRDLIIKGDVSVSVYPLLGVVAHDVTLSNPEGFSRKQMMELKTLALSLELMPLFQKKVVVKEFTLTAPKVYLERNAKGVGNWEFTFASEKKPSGGAMREKSSFVPEDFRLGTIRITDGIFVWKDKVSGTEQQLKNANLYVELDRLNSPFAFTLKALWKDKPLHIALKLKNFAQAVKGNSTGFDALIETPYFTLDYEGDAYVKTANGVSYHSNGELSLASDSLVALGKWLGTPIDLGGNTPAKIALNSKLELANNIVSLKAAKVTLDSISARGDLKVNVSKSVPFISGTLATDMFDVNPFIPANAELAAKGGEVKNSSKGWSTDPYNFDWCKSLDMDLAIAAGGVRYHNIKVGKSSLTTTIKSGLLTVAIKEMALYGGQGRGTITVDARGRVPVIDKVFSLQGIESGQFLVDAFEFDRLSGKASADMRFKGAGRSQRDIVANLNGNGKFVFADGALKGANIAAMVRNFKAKLLGGEQVEKKTDFAELAASFTIRNGIFHNEDLSLKAPVLRVTGAGDINLVERMINYRLVAKLVATLKGQGGSEDKKGIPIPILVTGSFDNPHYAVDVAGMVQETLSDPEAIKNTIEDFKDKRENIKEEIKNVKDQIKDIKSQVKDAKSLLKGILGKD